MIRDSRGCVDCLKPLPQEEGDTSTLISTKYGWRLIREKLANGDLTAVWRCPECWIEYKRKTGRA